MKIKTNRILLITPPFTQFSSPYAAVPFLAGMLNRYNIENTMIDLSIETALKFFSKDGLKRLFSKIEKSGLKITGPLKKFIRQKEEYINAIDCIIDFLQGENTVIAEKISGRKFLPENKRFDILNTVDIEASGINEISKLISSLFIDDIYDLSRNTVLPMFGLSSYNEKLALPSASFDPIYDELKNDDLIAELMFEVLDDYDLTGTELAAITIPFPGNLFGALKTAVYLRKTNKNIKIAFGGGYVNTELKNLKEKRIFEFADFICHDNGEVPLLRVIDFIQGKSGFEKLVRTFILDNDSVVFKNDLAAEDIYRSDAGYPDYKNFNLEKYFSFAETTNKMQRLWSEKGFLKLRMASGCYHHKCSFCDTKLQYISEYKPMDAEELIVQVEKIISETSVKCFHFVDEAMPPVLVKKFCIELLKRKISISWWGNIRFEKNFDQSLCRLMHEAGCIAVTGGLESANERILKLMDKRISLEDNIRTCSNFAVNKILVHAYLIYGFPGETIEECVNSLEVIRQMFSAKIIDSAFYHRFSLTVHSPIYADPKRFNIKIDESIKNNFANNDVQYSDNAKTGIDKIGSSLIKAIYNFNYQNCLNNDINDWFDIKINITIPENFVSRLINP